MIASRKEVSSGPARSEDRHDVDDFDSFFRAVFPRAVAVAMRVTTDRAAAEDAAIEALAKAHARWRRLRGVAWRDLWVFKVATNEAIRRLPRKHEMPGARVVSDPAEEVVNRRTLTDALRTMPSRQREVIVMRYLVGLSETEVATALNVSENTVKTHLRRGISGLRDRLEPKLKEEDLARLS